MGENQSDIEDGAREEEYVFTCRICGSHELQIIYKFIRVKYYEKTLPCTCGGGFLNSFAILKRYHAEVECQWIGWLNEEHLVDWEEREEGDEIDIIDDEEEIYCRQCLQEAGDYGWAICLDHSRIDEEGEEWFVYCGGCGREIEFG